MGEEKIYQINDTHRAIDSVIKNLSAWESPRCDGRVKAIIITKLQEARLWSLELVKFDDIN